VFVWLSVFLDACGTKAKKPHIKENPCFLALPPSAARPTKQHFLENVWLFGLGTPGLQKTLGQQKHFRISLSFRALPIRKSIA
jgi:hypothetical protein